VVDRRAVISECREAEISGSKVRSRDIHTKRFIRSGI
jgi:hypothetical protein